jgi:hypothetical protein
MRKVDGCETLCQPIMPMSLDLAARETDTSHARRPPPGNFHSIRDTTPTPGPFLHLGCLHGRCRQDAVVSTHSCAGGGKFGQACPNFSPSAHGYVRARSMSGPDHPCKPERILTKDEVRAELARIRPSAADALNNAVAGHAARSGEDMRVHGAPHHCFVHATRPQN